MIEKDLNNLGRTDLQKLAKEYGVKANQKNTKLISALKKLITKTSTKEPIVGVVDDTEEDTPGLNEEVKEQDSTIVTDDKEKALQQVYINKASTAAKDEASAVPYISPVKVVEFMTDDESTQSKTPAKNNPNATFETDNLSIISEFMTEDEESLAMNCSKTSIGRMPELSQLNQTSSESNTKSDDDKLPASREEAVSVKVDNSAQLATEEAPCAEKILSELSCQDEDAGADCQANAEVAHASAFDGAPDHSSTVDAAESGSGDKADEKHAEENDEAVVMSSPHTIAGDNSPGLNDTFSVKKPTSARRRPKIAPPQPNKEVAKQTTFAEWQKERRQRKKGATTKNCRRSPRIRTITAEAESPQANTSSAAAANKTRKVTKNIPKTPVPPITPKNIPKTPVPPITPKNVTKTPAKSSKKAASTPKASKKATEGKAAATSGTRKVKDFRKLHENMFQQMESIYEHRDRKKQRAEKMLSSTKKQPSTSSAPDSAVKTTGKSAKRILESSTGEKQMKIRKVSASTADAATKAKEEEPGKKEAKSKLKAPTRWSHKLHAAPSSKPASSAGASSAGAVFKPSVTEVKNIKTNFSLKTPVKFSRSRLLERKPAAVKTEQAATASTSKKLQTPKKVVVPRVLKTPAKENLKSVVAKSTPAKTHITPFKVGGNSFVESPRLKKFDIKESLKRPLNYVPHKGPLKEYTDTTKVSLKTLTAASKQKQTASRMERRREAQTNRSNARSNVLMKKRAGLQ